MARILITAPFAELLQQFQSAPDMELSWVARPEQNVQLAKGEFNGRGYEYNFLRAKVDPRSILEMRKAIEAERPEIVHAFYGRAISHVILATTGMRKPPRIVTFRGITSRLKRFDPGEWITYMHPRSIAHACESNAVRDSLVASGVKASRCHTVYNYVIPQQKSEQQRLVSRKEFGIPDDALVVGTVANMRPVKGIDILLQAAHHCADLHNVYWLLVGQVRDARVKRLIQSSPLKNRLIVTGFRNDARQLMQAMDVFVMPSRKEALCRALLEAMSIGLCPVVSDAGGLPEAVRDGVDGRVFPRENFLELAQTLREVLSNPNLMKQFGASSQSRASDEFSIAKWSSRLMDFYRSVLAI